MRIGLLAPEFLPNWGGVGTYCVELAGALCGDVELDVITLERQIYGQPSMTATEMEAYFNGGIGVHVIAHAADTFLYNANFQMAVRRYLVGEGSREGFDLVHSQHAHMSHLLYGLLGKQLPILTTLHTTIDGQRRGIEASQTPFEQLEPSEKWQLVLQPGLRIAERLALGSSDWFVTMSRWMRDTVRREMPALTTPIDVVPNGVDTNRYMPERASECDLIDGVQGPVILLSSRPTAAKGIPFAIDAMPKIHALNKEAHFVFAGGGDIEPWRRAMALKEVPDECVSFLGYVPYDKLPTLYARASVYLMPTLYENVPLRMLEAMSSGAPVVATSVNGIPEVIQHMENGLLVRPRDSDAIARAVLQLLDDPALARSLSKAARRAMVTSYDWKVVARRMVDSYHRLLGDG